MFLDVNQQFFMRLIWEIKLCSQMCIVGQLHTAASLDSVMADDKVRDRFFGAMFDDQSEIFMDYAYSWILHRC